MIETVDLARSPADEVASERIPDPAERRSRTRRGRRVRLGFAILALLIATALLAPVLAPFDPLRQDLASSLQGPTRAHPLGTDALGRDTLSRLLFGTRLSLGIGATATAAALALGALLGAAAGYARRSVDELIMRATDVLLAFPGVLFAVALASVLGPSARNVVIALAVVGWPSYARLVRAEVRATAALDFVVAAEALGAGSWRVIRRHLLAAVRPALLVQATFGLSGAIVAEASLSFLGLGPPPPAPTWGGMLAEGRSLLVVAPHLTLAPAAAVFTTILAIHWIGDGLSAAASGRVDLYR